MGLTEKVSENKHSSQGKIVENIVLAFFEAGGLIGLYYGMKYFSHVVHNVQDYFIR